MAQKAHCARSSKSLRALQKPARDHEKVCAHYKELREIIKKFARTTKTARDHESLRALQKTARDHRKVCALYKKLREIIKKLLARIKKLPAHQNFYAQFKFFKKVCVPA